MFTFADEFLDNWIILAQFTTSLHGKKPSFTNNFTKRKSLENSVFSICFPTSEYILQIPNFPCVNPGKIGSLLFVFLYFTGMARLTPSFLFKLSLCCIKGGLNQNTGKVHGMTIFPFPTVQWAWIEWWKLKFLCRKLTELGSVWNCVYRVFAESASDSVCTYLLFQFQTNKKEITKYEVDFKKFFCWRSNLSRMMTLEVRSENGYGSRGQVCKRVWKMSFLVWNRVKIWRTGRHTPTKNSQEYPQVYLKLVKSSQSVINAAFWLVELLLGYML